MRSHRVIPPSTTLTLTAPGAVGSTEHYRCRNIIVCGSSASAFATFTVTRNGVSYDAIFSATVGFYHGPFEFGPEDQVVVVTQAGTTVLLDGFINSRN